MLLGLIDDILDLSKVRARQVDLNMEPVSLADVIRTSIGSLKHLAARKSQNLHFADPSKDALIPGNGSALGRVFNNLLSNAIKFTPEGGDIAVVFEPAQKDKVRVKIMDTGIGIAQDKLPYLFDPYTQTSQSGTGGEQGRASACPLSKRSSKPMGSP